MNRKNIAKSCSGLLLALFLVAGELADMSDGLRYRKAAVDLAQIYFADELVSIEKQGQAQQAQDWDSKMKKDLDQALRSKK